MSANNELMVVLTTFDVMEAHIVAGRLKSEGIDALVSQEPAGSALGITFGLLGEVKVAVLAADYEAAMAILDVDAPPELPEDLDQIIFDSDDEP